jgi:thymidylate synthase (FAD)
MRVEYITHSGDDLLIVNAARASFDRRKNAFDEVDARLLQFLAREGHWTPFAHPVVTVREHIPIFVARQRMRHTVGFTYSEASRRYTSSTSVTDVIFPQEWRAKPDNAKSGSGGPFAHQQWAHEVYDRAVQTAAHAYSEMIAAGVAPEQARMVLPQSAYTTLIVTGTLAAWMRAYTLRSAPDAQKEIQDLAHKWREIIEPLYPIAWSALCPSSE